MKKATGVLVVLLVLLTGLLTSCVSTKLYKPLSYEDSGKVELAGSVQCNFYTINYLGAGRISRSTKQQAYIELMKEANKTHEGNFDIRNISIAYVGINLEHGNEFTANGTVVIEKAK
jgi:hypothetical protein